MVDPRKVAEIMGGPALLHRRIRSLDDLRRAVDRGLPREALDRVAERVFEPRSPELTALRNAVIAPATRKRRETLKSDESERVARLARIVATAIEVWDDEDDARAFLTTPHAELGGASPIEIAVSELGARQVEELLWRLHHGVPA